LAGISEKCGEIGKYINLFGGFIMKPFTKKRPAKVKKGFLCLFLALTLFFSLSLATSEAVSGIKVTINGQPLQTDVAPV
jgi:hypothetical protein